MPRFFRPSLSDLTGEAMLSSAFERLRPRLLAMIGRRIGHKLAARVDPEGVVQDAYLRAQARWAGMNPRPADLDVWIYGQVRDRLIERVRAALGPERDADRDIGWPDESAAPLADLLVDSRTGATSALSRAERCAVVRAALERLKPLDAEILALRYFDELEYPQIEEILGLKANAANKRALRALMKLRDWIPNDYRPPEARQP